METSELLAYSCCRSICLFRFNWDESFLRSLNLYFTRFFSSPSSRLFHLIRFHCVIAKQNEFQYKKTSQSKENGWNKQRDKHWRSECFLYYASLLNLSTIYLSSVRANEFWVTFHLLVVWRVCACLLIKETFHSIFSLNCSVYNICIAMVIEVVFHHVHYQNNVR